MSYCTDQQIKDRRLTDSDFVALLDDESIGSDNEKIPVRLSAVLSDTDAEIDSYLGGYALPLESIPDALVTIAVDIAVYGIFSRRGAGEENKAVKARYDRAVARLKEIRDAKANGKDLLFPIAPVVVSNSSLVMVNKTDSDREFSQSKLAQML